jgi:hypothetical protein
MNAPKPQSKPPHKPNGALHPPSVPLGGSVSAKDVHALAETPVVLPEVNKTYIQSLAATKGAHGESEVRNYHLKLFLELNAELTARCEQLRVRVAAEGEGITRQITELSAINNNTDRYHERCEPTLPKTRLVVCQVVFFLLCSLVLLLVGLNTNAQVLLASGVPGFESPWRAYLFSTVPIGLAFGLKALRHFLAQRQHQKYYTVAIWIVGLLLGVRWVALFAQTFPAMTQSVGDIINNLSAGQGSANPGVGLSFIIVSMLAESFLAAGCWLTVEAIVEKHQPSARLDNPAYVKTQADLDHWHHRQYEQQGLHAKIHGKLTALDEARQRFIEEAVGLFHLAQASASHNQHLKGLFEA